MAALHPSVKIKKFPYKGTDKSLIDNVEVSTSTGPTTIRFFSANSKIRQEVFQILKNEAAQRISIEDSRNCVAMSNSSRTAKNILKAINVLKEKNYIASDFATEICQNFPDHYGNPHDITKGQVLKVERCTAIPMHTESLSSYSKLLKPHGLQIKQNRHMAISESPEIKSEETAIFPKTSFHP